MHQPWRLATVQPIRDRLVFDAQGRGNGRDSATFFFRPSLNLIEQIVRLGGHVANSISTSPKSKNLSMAQEQGQSFTGSDGLA
jgi:hypothetical protein